MLAIKYKHSVIKISKVLGFYTLSLKEKCILAIKYKHKLAVVVPCRENAHSAHWFSSPCVPGFDLH